MPARSEDLQKPWKLNLSATLAGKTEYLLTDPITGKPKYGARVRLVEALLERWIAEQEGRPLDSLPPVPTLAELRRL